jgi:hypothetical protein
LIYFFGKLVNHLIYFNLPRFTGQKKILPIF